MRALLVPDVAAEAVTRTLLAQWPEIKPPQHEATDERCSTPQNILDALKALVMRPEIKASLKDSNRRDLGVTSVWH